MTSPAVRSGRPPASIVVAVVMIGLSVVWSVIGALAEDGGSIGDQVFPAMISFALGIGLWRRSRVVWCLTLALGVVWIALAALVLLVVSDEGGAGMLTAVAGIVTGGALVVALLLPSARTYTWTKKPAEPRLNASI